jgi:hypothetical protein
MFFKKDNDLKKPETDGARPIKKRDPDFIKISTLQLLKIILIDKFLLKKPDTYSLEHGDRGRLVADIPPVKSPINYIAIVLDEEVQEVLRAENRLAALFLSGPDFIEFDPNGTYPKIGWKFINGEFINPQSEDAATQNNE